MPVETFEYLDSLNPSYPAPSDAALAGDDHIRGVKATLKATFPNITGPVTASHTALNALFDRGPSLKDGTPSAPPLHFTTETTLGLFRASEGRIGISGILRGNGAVPAGAIQDFAMATAPTGWLVCDGQAISRTDFKDLFDAIGTTWGVGNGSTTFNVPNLVNRFRRHRTPAGQTNLAGDVGTLKNPAIQSHTHSAAGITDVQGWHGHSGTTDVGGVDHTHPYMTANNHAGSVGGGGSYGAWGQGITMVQSNGATAYLHGHTFNTNGAGDHAHNVSVTVQANGDVETRPWSAAVLTCIKL